MHGQTRVVQCYLSSQGLDVHYVGSHRDIVVLCTFLCALCLSTTHMTNEGALMKRSRLTPQQKNLQGTQPRWLNDQEMIMRQQQQPQVAIPFLQSQGAQQYVPDQQQQQVNPINAMQNAQQPKPLVQQQDSNTLHQGKCNSLSNNNNNGRKTDTWQIMYRTKTINNNNPLTIKF